MTLAAPKASPPLPDVLDLPRSVATDLLAHARAELPNEACGVLSGGLATGRITRFHPARNALASPWRFEVAPDDLVRIVVGIEEAGDDLVAVFHSHPRTAALPSPTDRRELRYGAVLLIASLAGNDAPRLRAWRVEDQRASEVALRIT